ncbi:MAG: deoxyguanosinetriphosphate triphosphohydrolase [Mycobacteriales bacterium]
MTATSATPPAYAEQDLERWVAEPAKAAPTGRTPFERDRARVLHSAALRRLAAKTQVVGVGEDDFPRTRLTHSLECAQIGRELAFSVGADPDVVDAACLAHDLGHPPFGHNGETALDEAAADCGGFEGNAQSLRVLTRLEAKVLQPDGASAGLNLTRAVLDAATKYPWPRLPERSKYGVYADDRPVFDWLRRNAPRDRPCLEAQVMDWADDVAYSVHDLEDGIHAGHVRLADLADADEQAELCTLAAGVYSDRSAAELAPLLAALLGQDFWPREYDGSLAAQVGLKRLTSELIGRFCSAALTATRKQAGSGPLTRYAANLAVPADVRAECALLKAVTARYVMARAGVVAAQEDERALVAELVGLLLDRAPAALDRALRPAYDRAIDDGARLRVVIDQVARLTDTSARGWHAALSGS